MTAKQAQTITKLDTRENKGKVHNEWLRCCLGEWEQVIVQTSAFRSVPQKVFRLIAFGADWESAVNMWERMQKREKTA